MTIKTNVKANKLNRGRSVSVYAVLVLCATTAIALPAQTFTTLHSFDISTDGANPEAALIQATNGDLYGTTFNGGANNNGGTIFKITPSGTLTTLYSFCSQSGCMDGANPGAALVQATSGDFYGTTNLGGTIAASYGTAFKMTPGGVLTTLISFDGGAGGAYPGPLVQGADGNFYGTTFSAGLYGDGIVFSMTSSGVLNTLVSFDGLDGALPYTGLVPAATDFYGTTSGGGTSGYGTVFEIGPSGMLTTLYNFCSQSGCTDGNFPEGLIQATNGDFYGTTALGGANDLGTVFEIGPSGTLTTLHSFDRIDGSNPQTVLIEGSDGNFYGTTSDGGATGYGTIFEIAPGGTLTTLHSFCRQSFCTDGRNPQAGLIQDTNGTFYGTTSAGGATGSGTVFSLSVGLGPFVKTQPVRGEVGATVRILGTDLTGATSVRFNGTAATFTVLSPSLITTAVPVGATSGNVQVTTPNGTLLSNVAFTVRP